MPGTPIAKSASFFSANSFDLLRRHDLLGERLQVLGSSGGMLERAQVAVDAERRRTADLEVQVGCVLLRASAAAPT